MRWAMAADEDNPIPTNIVLRYWTDGSQRSLDDEGPVGSIFSVRDIDTMRWAFASCCNHSRRVYSIRYRVSY